MEDNYVKGWMRRQHAQCLLLRATSTLRGCRAQVYRARGATQWYTAVIVGCNQETGVIFMNFLTSVYSSMVLTGGVGFKAVGTVLKDCKCDVCSRAVLVGGQVK